MFTEFVKIKHFPSAVKIFSAKTIFSSLRVILFSMKKLQLSASAKMWLLSHYLQSESDESVKFIEKKIWPLCGNGNLPLFHSWQFDRCLPACKQTVLGPASYSFSRRKNYDQKHQICLSYQMMTTFQLDRSIQILARFVPWQIGRTSHNRVFSLPNLVG